MIRFLNLLLSLAFLSFSLPPCWAGSPGSRSGEVLKFGAGAKNFALAGAQAGSVDDVFSLRVNPAGLASLDYQQAFFLYTDHIEGVNLQSLLYGYPGGRLGAFAVGLTRLKVGEFQGYDNSGDPVEMVSAEDRVVAVGYGNKFRADMGSVPGEFQVGGSFKWLHSRLHDVSASGYGFDIGLLYRLFAGHSRIGAGVAVQNIGRGLKFDRERFGLPLTFRAGLSAMRPFFGAPLTFNVDYDVPSDDRNSFALSLEDWILNIVALRAGYRFKRDSGIGVFAGAGVKIKLFELDYGFALMGDFGAAHRFGLTFHWGKPVEVAPDWGKIEKARRFRELGRYWSEQGRYLEAVKYFNKALEYDPGNKEILKEMREAYTLLRGMTE